MDNQHPSCHIFCESVAEGSVLSFVRSLGKKNVSVYIYLLGDKKGLLSVYTNSRYCKEVLVVNEENFLTVLSNRTTSASSKKNILLPFSDKTALLVANNREFLENFYTILQAEAEVIMGMLDKAKASKLSSQCGLLLPVTYYISNIEDLIAIKEHIPFPAILKPKWYKTNKSNNFKAVIVKNKQELIRHANTLLRDGTKFIIQEYIKGGDESIEFFLFYRTKEGKIYSCSGKKIFQYPQGAGIMAIGSTSKENFLLKDARILLKCINYHGFGGLEFKSYGDKRYFIEMNARPEGITHIAISSGLDLPWIGYTDAAGLNLSESLPTSNSKISYYFNPFCCWGVIKSSKHKIRTCKRIISLILSKKATTDIICLKDIKPSIVLFYLLIKRKLISCISR